MKRPIAILGLFCVAMSMQAPSAEASWVSQHCYSANHSTSAKTRQEARTYADVARYEGYQWAGGCWNDDDVDNSPGHPPGDPNTDGEGPDCSGFTFKSWHLKDASGVKGWHWWSRWQDKHGPYGTWHFRNPSGGGPFVLLPNKSRTTTDVLDAFVYNQDGGGHIGMLYSTVPPSDNLDWILEAKGESYGTDLNQEDYRFDSRYKAVARVGWAPPCYVPPCDQPGVVVVR